MRRPSTYRAEKTGATVTMEQMLVAFQRASEALRVSAYRTLTGQTNGADDTPLDDMEIVTRSKVAKLMHFKDAHAVDAYRRAGRLTPVYFPGGSRVRGFTAQSVRALLNGGTVAATTKEAAI